MVDDSGTFLDKCTLILESMGIFIKGREEWKDILLLRGKSEDAEWFIAALPQGVGAPQGINDILKGYAGLGLKIAVLSPSITAAGKNIPNAVLITGRKFKEMYASIAGDGMTALLRYMAYEKYDRAAELLKNTADKQKSREALLIGGQFFERIGEYQQALESYRMAFKKYSVPQALRGMATVLGAMGRYDEAISCYSRLLEKDGNDLSALRGRAIIYLNKGMLAEAIRDLEIVVEKSADPEDIIHLAAARLLSGERGKAKQLLKQLPSEKRTPLARAMIELLNLGAEEVSKGNKESMHEKIENEQNGMIASIQRSGLLEDELQTEKLVKLLAHIETKDARSALMEIVKRQENGSLLFMELKEDITFNSGQFGEAELLGRLLLARKFDNEYRRRIACSLYNQGKHREALEFLSGMEDSVTRAFRGAIRLKLNERVIDDSPFPDIRNNTGVSLLREGRDASEYFMDMEYLPAALNNLGVSLHISKEDDEAVESLKKAGAYLWEAKQNLGMIYMDRGMYSEAAEMLEASVKFNPRAELFNDLGIAYAKLEKYDMAKKSFSRALELNPDFKKSRKNLKRLERLMS